MAEHRAPGYHKQPVKRLYASPNFCSIRLPPGPPGFPAPQGSKLSRHCAERDEGPHVLSFRVAQDIAVAVGGQDAEIGLARGIPAVLDGGDFQSAVALTQAKR